MNVKRMAVLTRLCCWTLALLLAAGACLADELRIEDRGVDLTAEISIHYPAVTGMADAGLQDAVNEKILADPGVPGPGNRADFRRQTESGMEGRPAGRRVFLRGFRGRRAEELQDRISVDGLLH